ncbi:cadherin-like beta sandwich domain-containing protein, partial [Paenibacillus sp. CAU 1782]
LTLTPSPSAPTNGNVVVGIEASVAGEAAGNSLAELRAAKGDQAAAYFIGGGGEDVLNTAEFIADENGTYTVYARDAAGNETVERITISNVDRMKPTLTLTSDYTAPTNGNVTISVNASDSESGLSTVRWSAASPETENSWPSEEVEDGVFIATANGLYTVIAHDYAGNSTVQQINVMNIYRDEPGLQLSLETEEPTGERVAVLAQVSSIGDGNSIATVEWAEGEQSIAFFSGGAGTDITEARQFDAQTNGVYTVFAKDAAGNEAVATIEVDNIRRVNAELAVLTLSADGQPVTLSPVFDPQQTHYTAEVTSEVASVLLMATTDDAAASVTVDGKALHAGEEALVSLSYGANTVNIEATAELASVKQIYEIVITRARPAVSVPTTRSPIFGLKLNGQEVTGLAESSIVDASGALHYELKLESAGAIVSAASASGDNVLRVESPSGVAHKAEQVLFTFPAEVLQQLKDLKIKLVLSIGDTVYEMPLDFSQSVSTGLSVQLAVPGETEVADRLLDRASTGLTRNWHVERASAAVSFASDGIEGKGSLLLPLPEALDAAGARKLAVYMEVENGEKRLVAGKVRFDDQGKVIGIAIETEGSGQAIVLTAEPIITSHGNYMNGYGDGRFAPDREVTRAELAALLAKLSPAGQAGAANGESSAFGDVPQEHWAAEAIANAAASSWMNGGPDGSFRPESSLTRAELAVVLVRWRAVQGMEQSSRFPDAAEHWAASAISIVSEKGWLTGYEDGSFRPDRLVTRAQAVVVLNRVLDRPKLTEGGRGWQDVPASHWAADAIRSATQSFREEAYLNGDTEVIATQ